LAKILFTIPFETGHQKRVEGGVIVLRINLPTRGVTGFACFILIFSLLFLPQNEGIRRPVSDEDLDRIFLCQIYPHRVIHIVEKLSNKNYTLKINDL